MIDLDTCAGPLLSQPCLTWLWSSRGPFLWISEPDRINLSLLFEGFNHNGVSVHWEFWYHEREIPPTAGHSAIVPHSIVQQSTPYKPRLLASGKDRTLSSNHAWSTTTPSQKTHQASRSWLHASCMTQSEARSDTRLFLPACLLTLLLHSKYAPIP